MALGNENSNDSINSLYLEFLDAYDSILNCSGFTDKFILQQLKILALYEFDLLKRDNLANIMGKITDFERQYQNNAFISNTTHRISMADSKKIKDMKNKINKFKKNTDEQSSMIKFSNPLKLMVENYKKLYSEYEDLHVSFISEQNRLEKIREDMTKLKASEKQKKRLNSMNDQISDHERNIKNKKPEMKTKRENLKKILQELEKIKNTLYEFCENLEKTRDLYSKTEFIAIDNAMREILRFIP